MQFFSPKSRASFPNRVCNGACSISMGQVSVCSFPLLSGPFKKVFPAFTSVIDSYRRKQGTATIAAGRRPWKKVFNAPFLYSHVKTAEVPSPSQGQENIASRCIKFSSGKALFPMKSLCTRALFNPGLSCCNASLCQICCGFPEVLWKTTVYQ